MRGLSACFDSTYTVYSYTGTCQQSPEPPADEFLVNVPVHREGVQCKNKPPPIHINVGDVDDFRDQTQETRLRTLLSTK